jgi:LPS-assembly protein
MKLFFKIIFLIFFAVAPIYGIDNISNQSPISISADKFEYSGGEGERRLIASDNVEAIQDSQKVYAQLIEYDYQKELLIAENQVKVLERDGYIIEADKIILTDRLKFGSIKHFTVLFPDKSILRGEFAQKKDEALTEIEQGYYTACKICPGKAPIWSITSKEASYDQKEASVTYKHAIFNVYGVPTFYTPYLFHYTKKSKRRSGFLKPSYGGSSYLGGMVKIPYYFNIAPNQDATLTTLITKKQGNALEGEHRYLLPQGQINNKGSIASAKNFNTSSGQSKPSHSIRYDFESNSNLSLTKRNEFGWDSKTVSDKTYRKDYGYGSEDTITSEAYNHSYQDDGFYKIKTISFQNLRPKTDYRDNAINQTPMVLPLFESKHKIFRFTDDSSLNFETNMLKIHRYNGPDSNRLYIKNKWHKSVLLNNGHEFNFFSSLRNDVYHYEKAPIENHEYTGTTSRAIPEAGLDWSYPLSKRIKDTNLMLTPTISAIAVPYSKYNRKIYNEDSSSSNELNDGNLFAPSQFNGIDLVENTPRASYGIKGDAYYQDYLNGNALFGQLYRHKPTESPDTNESRFSDYVGRLKFDLHDSVIVSYQYKIDKDNFINKSNEAAVMLKYGKAYVLTDLLYYRDNKRVNGVKNRRELYLETGINNYNDISVSVNARRNLSSKKDNPDLYLDPNGFISVGGRLKYLQDCVEYSTSVNKDFTQNKDKKANTTWWFDISLKNIS